MKIIIGIIVAAVTIIGLLLVVGLFLNKEYVVSRAVLVNKSRSSVFEYLKLLKNQNKFSKWASMDKNMKTEFTGTDGTVGFISAWDSNEKNVGKGEQKIIKIAEGEKIDYEIHFIKPFNSTSYASMTTSDAGNDMTKVTWEFNGKMKYPMNLMLLFMNMEKMIGNDLTEGLNNLKTILEK